MSNTLQLIERVRSVTETGTDYAVAKALGMNQSYLIRIKKGKSWPGPASQMRMSELLTIDLRDIVALINEDKAKTESDRSYWRSLCSAGVRAALDSASKAAAACVIGAALIFPGKNAEASVANATDTALPSYTLCALCMELAGEPERQPMPSALAPNSRLAPFARSSIEAEARR